MDHRVTEYRQVADELAGIESPGGELSEICQTFANNILKLASIVITCDNLGIPTNTLFEGVNVRDFLNNDVYREALGMDHADVANSPASNVLRKVYAYIKGRLNDVQALNLELIVVAGTLFMQKYDKFKCEVENEKINQEIRLDRLRFEEVNKKELDITIRNTYITLAGVIITALLTMANIIVTIMLPK
ncbi:hypothetical protein BGZ98_008960 [Dissophora globulifera]|nr:hypothetical protein BGZ98_008960 [Dissophora globulifera]